MSDETEQPGAPKRRFRMPSMPALPELGELPLLGKLKPVDEPADEPSPADGASSGAVQERPKERGRRLPKLPGLPGMPEMPDIDELATHLSRLFQAPTPYLTEPWEVSLASLVDKVPHVPDIAVKALGLLDGFGAVHIGPRKVGFDGDEIEWDKVVALRTRRVSDMISGAVLEREVDRLRQYLPPVPGRKWAVGKAVDLLVVLSMVALEDELEFVLGLVDGARDLDGATDQVTRDGRVVSEIVYKGWVRKEKELQGGLLASAVLAQVHGADHCLREMAAARGIPVVQAEDGNDLEDAAEKAAAIRRRIEELRARIPMLRRDPTPDPADELEAGEQPPNPPPAMAGPPVPTGPAWTGGPPPAGWPSGQGGPMSPPPAVDGWPGGDGSALPPTTPGAPPLPPQPGFDPAAPPGQPAGPSEEPP
ncbi:hypothetical protein [Flindersiella endophytica]